MFFLGLLEFMLLHVVFSFPSVSTFSALEPHVPKSSVRARDQLLGGESARTTVHQLDAECWRKGNKTADAVPRAKVGVKDAGHRCFWTWLPLNAASQAFFFVS